VKREVYEKLGSFYGMTYGEDWEMWVRIARYYPVAYTPEVLAQYREHKASISKTKSAQGKITQDFLTGIHLIRELLPNEHRDRVIRIAKKNCALFNMGTAFRIWDNTRDRSLVLMQVKQAFALSKQPAVCYSALKLFVKMALFLSRPKPGQSGTRMPIAEHQKQLIK
jgi:hypothetical protein